MDDVEQIALATHIIGSTLWVGSMFLNRFVVWPALRDTYAQQGFPLEFLVVEGRMIAPRLYTAIALVFTSGVALVMLRPPASTAAWVLLAAKAVALLVMSGITLYGTFVTWPKLQFATLEETWLLWRGYGARVAITFACGLAAILMGVLLRTA